MRKLHAILLALMIGSSAFTQPPQKMSYQAVIRNSSAQLVTNHAVGMRISILQGSSNGTTVYTETQTPTTNTNGLVSIEIGGIGFNSIDWANGTYFIKTETDPTGGTDYTITGTSQLLSVPFAMISMDVVNNNDADSDVSNEIQNISLIDDKLSIENGNEIIFTQKFGDWQDQFSPNTIYQVNSDGFLYIQSGILGLEVLSDRYSPPTEKIAQESDLGVLMVPIKRGHYWKITNFTNPPLSIKWLPLNFSYIEEPIQSLMIDSRDGQTYKTIRIGDQTWMAENLNYGNMISNFNNATNNAVVEKYCIDNNNQFCDSLGGLYQWDEAMNYSMSQGSQGICPVGWHLPTDNDWKILLLEIGESQENVDKDSSCVGFFANRLHHLGDTGFDLLMASYRGDNGLIGTSPGGNGFYWSSSPIQINTKWWYYYRRWSNGNVSTCRLLTTGNAGFSVRCVKD